MSDIAALVEAEFRSRLEAYRIARADIPEHAGIEESVLSGGYSYRQVLELVQNGADAILEANEQSDCVQQDARIEVVLHGQHLYVANTGAPLSPEGVIALLHSHSSPKRGNQIGRFGLGFKSLLRLGGRLDILSRSGSLRFYPEHCRNEIRRKLALDDSTPVPGLRLAWVLDRQAEEATDPILAGHSWATTIIRAEISNPDIIPHLQEEVRKFPAPFLLFLPVAVSLDLDAGDGARRQLRRIPDGPDFRLFDGNEESRWRFVETAEVRVTDTAAKADATHLHAREVVPLAWAMPLDAKRESAGHFWAFFPTDTATHLPGILNAPWKVNNDRSALIAGEWNNALMREAAGLIARTLSELATEADPGRPLDAFPRRLERQDDLAAPLVEALWARILAAVIIPDAQGTPQPSEELKRPPLDDADSQGQWRELAPVEARVRWVHPACLTGDRPKRLEALAERLSKAKAVGLSRAEASDWFA
ncbi:MAG TPA: hypothetical protein DHV85_01675, partial [Candidatus Accumulibacter sp.]|nr:hypothetical protein [Accumulibacter sp.]